MLNIFANTLNTAVLAARNGNDSGSKSRDVPLQMRRSGPTITESPNELKTTPFTCAGKSYNIGTGDAR